MKRKEIRDKEMRKIFNILCATASLSLLLGACAKIDSVRPFDEKQATILIHHMYPQTRCMQERSCDKRVPCGMRTAKY